MRGFTGGARVKSHSGYLREKTFLRARVEARRRFRVLYKDGYLLNTLYLPGTMLVALCIQGFGPSYTYFGVSWKMQV